MKKGEPLTLKQERFAQAYMRIGCATQAYREAYDASGMKATTIHVKACQYLKQDKIRIRLDALKVKQRQKDDVTLDTLTVELEEIRQRSLEAERFSACVSAVMGKARIHGLDTQQVKVAVKKETTSAERLVMLQSLLSRTHPGHKILAGG